MDGFGVNTYRMVNAKGEGVLVKYHWKTQQGVESLTQAQADAIQATELGSASKDLYEAIERGDFPRWELNVQIMSRRRAPGARLRPARRHQDLAGGRLPAPTGRDDDARTGTSTTSSPRTSRSAFGTGVLVDGLEFSDDKMLVGRTFSYSDTQRYRVGPELPAAAGQRAARQAGHQPARRPDGLLGGRHRAEPARQLRAQLHGWPAGVRAPQAPTTSPRSTVA